MKVLFSIIIILIAHSINAQVGLDKLFKDQDPKELFDFQKKVDRSFASGWEFRSLTYEEIDHFKMGYYLTWKKKRDSLLIERSYIFNESSKLVYAHEKRFINDMLFSQGPVFLRGDVVDYIIQVFPQKKSLNFKAYWEYEVDYYTFEIFKDGVLSCIYKAPHRNHYYMLFENRSDKIELVRGDDCLSILK